MSTNASLYVKVPLRMKGQTYRFSNYFQPKDRPVGVKDPTTQKAILQHDFSLFRPVSLADGYLHITVHWDGGLGVVGKELETYYNTFEKVLNLFCLGHLDSLQTHTKGKPKENCFTGFTGPTLVVPYACDPYKNGETWEDCAPDYAKSLREARNTFNYAFMYGRWHVKGQTGNRWLKLSDARRYLKEYPEDKYLRHIPDSWE